MKSPKTQDDLARAYGLIMPQIGAFDSDAQIPVVPVLTSSGYVPDVQQQLARRPDPSIAARQRLFSAMLRRGQLPQPVSFHED